MEEAVRFDLSTCNFGLLENIRDIHKGRSAPLPVNLIQKTRNADVTSDWRTIRVLRAEDSPLDSVIPLNRESRFIKKVIKR